MKCVRVLLVTVESLYLLFGKINTRSVKGNKGNEMATIFLKSDVYDPFQSSSCL